MGEVLKLVMTNGDVNTQEVTECFRKNLETTVRNACGLADSCYLIGVEIVAVVNPDDSRELITMPAKRCIVECPYTQATYQQAIDMAGDAAIEELGLKHRMDRYGPPG